jgi:hypothetical protein
MRTSTDDAMRARGRDEEHIRRLPLAAMFTALGVLFPQLFHMLGLGSTFLPMFLPVLAAGLLLPWRLAATVGVLTPLLSWMLTGMPPLSPPMLPLMVLELGLAAPLAGLFRRSLRWPVIAAVAATMATDRLLLYIVIEAVSTLAGVRHPLLGPAAVLAGFPGVALAVVVLPPAIALIESRYPRLATVRVRGN